MDYEASSTQVNKERTKCKNLDFCKATQTKRGMVDIQMPEIISLLNLMLQCSISIKIYIYIDIVTKIIILKNFIENRQFFINKIA